MKISRLSSLLAAAGLFVAVGAAQATVSFTFNPTGAGFGAGAIASATTLDQAVGSTLALNATNGGRPLAVDTQITDYYQANLAIVQDENGDILFSNGGSGKFFTFVATFTEYVTSSVVDGAGVKTTFGITGGTFKMCAQTASGNNLAGTGFACAGNGILSGTIKGGNATQTGFPSSLQPLDRFGADNWGGTQTVTSAGAASLLAQLDFVDAGYFPDLNVNTLLTLASVNSSLISPYDQVNPSRRFSSNTIANGDVAANVGAINGVTGPNFIFQSDANSSFAIPEPGSLAIVGVALAGLALVRRRKA